MFRFTARRVLLTGSIAALVAGFAATSAFATTTIAVGPSAGLVGKVVAQVPTTVACGPFEVFSAGGSVTVSQARGKQIAQGSGFFGPTTGNQVAIACDGRPQTLTIAVPANASGPPFKKGTAVASAFFSAGAFPTFESATAGPVTIRLR
jgi:hypothetical protein